MTEPRCKHPRDPSQLAKLIVEAVFSIQIQNHFNTITTQKLAIPIISNQPVTR